jgi:methionine-rich copper-binding protein CopC
MKSIFSACVLAAFLTTSIFGHTSAKEMSPTADATVASPKEVTIHFSGAMEPKFSSIVVLDATGHVVNKDVSVVGAEAKVMTVPLPALKPGVYTVNWVAVSVDTHRSEGSYKFTVK